MGVAIFIDVPSLDGRVISYGQTFELAVSSRPRPDMAMLEGGDVRPGLLARAAGSQTTPDSDATRTYQRHRTRVHLDVEVADFGTTLHRAQPAGAVVETLYREEGPRPAAFCADPFGHGFCLMGPRH